ncbi:phosphate ABC transporter permease PtsA, partial [Escherichia coli]
MAKTSSSSLQVQTEKELHIRHKRQLWRRQKNRIALFLSVSTMAFG